MYFTGFTRFSSEIQKTNKLTSKDKHRQLKEMHMLVDEAEKVLVDPSKDLDDFGRLLDVTWKLKRQTGSKISNEGIDLIYQKAMNAGALGGKILGAGGGGFFVFYVQPEYRQSVMESMEDLLYVPFEFENSGTKVIHYNQE